MKSQQTQYELKILIQAVEEIKQTNEVNNKNVKRLCQKIELITEYAVWGDQNDSQYFDYFCEQNIMGIFSQLMRRTKFKTIVIEIIQNVTILLSNITQKANLNYVLSNPALNEFIIYYHDFTDEEFVDYYVSMLKSISLRMDEENISLFFNERLSYFPVLWQAARFYNHREAMVRTAIRTVILGVMKINYPLAKKYLVQFPFVTFYAHFACYLRSMWMQLNQDVLKTRYSPILNEKYEVSPYIEGDLCYFFSDVYSFCPDATDILDNTLTHFLIVPAILSGFLYDRRQSVSLPLGLYLLIQLLDVFKQSKLPTILTKILLSPKLPQKIHQSLDTKIIVPQSFSSSWSFKNFWDTHFDYVLKHSNSLFNHQVITVPEQKQTADFEYIATINPMGISDELGVVQLLNADHNTQNTLRTIIIQFLTTKDDRLLYLVLKLISTLCDVNEVSDDLKRECRLLGEQNILTENQHIITQLLKLAQVDPPLRICTIISASQLVIRFTMKDGQLSLDQEHKQNLLESYRFATQKLLSQVNNKFYWDIVIDVFQKSHQQYYTDLEKIKTKVDHYALIPHRGEPSNELDAIYRLPSKLQEQASRDTAMFFIVKKLKALAFPHAQDSGTFTSKIITDAWDIGKNYEPDQRKLLPCIILSKTTKDKCEKVDSGPCYLVEDDDNFILVSPEIVKTKWALVLYKYRLNQVEAVPDRAEPRILFVSVSTNPYIDLQLYFEDHTLTQDAKKSIDQKRQSSKIQNYNQIVNILQEAQKESQVLLEQNNQNL